MRIDTVFLKQMINYEGSGTELAEWLPTIGIEIEAVHGSDRGVLEFEITPNRPDWLSHYGVAREIAAKERSLVFTPLDLPEFIMAKKPLPFRVVIEDPADCARYSGAIILDIKVKPSPPWLRNLIERLGLRPINNVVDISNLVMFTCGHPLHIFDLQILEKKEIRIRRAKTNEKLVLLDGQEVILGPDQLVIADGRKPVALAGIMGGQASGVTDATTTIFIESAHFHPPVIRRSCRALGLKTDASYRFERGMDVENTITAMRLAVKWLAEDQGKPLELAFFQDRYPRPWKPQVVRLEKGFADALTGIAMDPRSSIEILQRLGFGVKQRGGHWEVSTPSFRVDVTGPADLVEEIIRIHGYEHLDAELPPQAGTAIVPNRERELEMTIGQHLVAHGFYEVINYVFQAPEENRPFQLESADVRLKNPLGRDFSTMKAALLPGLLRNCRHNVDQNVKRIMLFEIGKVFSRNQAVQEKRNLALAVTGEYLHRDWRQPEAPFDFHHFRGLLDALFRHLRWPVEWLASKHPFFDPACCLAVTAGGKPAGHVGRIASGHALAVGLEQGVYAGEFDLEQLSANSVQRSFRMWNRFPVSRRDFSFLMDKTISYLQLQRQIDGLRPESLENHELLDVYEGKGIPAEKISLAMSFTYRGRDKTLSGEEVNEIHGRFIARLAEQLGLIQR